MPTARDEMGVSEYQTQAWVLPNLSILFVFYVIIKFRLHISIEDPLNYSYKTLKGTKGLEESLL